MVIKVPKGGRCPCRKRISHILQCQEEYAIDQKLCLEKYDTMWLQTDAYAVYTRSSEGPEIYHYFPSSPQPLLVTQNDNSPLAAHLVTQQMDPPHAALMITQQEASKKYASYNDVLLTAKQLADTTSNNREQREYANHFMKSLMQLFCTGDAEAVKKGMVDYISQAGLKFGHAQSGHMFENIDGSMMLSPLRGGDTTACAKNRSRKMGAIERNLKKPAKTKRFTHIAASGKIIEADIPLLGSSLTRTCTFCTNRGHRITSCRVREGYGTLLDFASRRVFAEGVLNATRFLTKPREGELTEALVMEELPDKIMCLVVHNRFLIDANITTPHSANNFCLECTVLRTGAQVDELYSRALFKLSPVTIYATKSMSVKLISQLQFADSSS